MARGAGPDRRRPGRPLTRMAALGRFLSRLQTEHPLLLFLVFGAALFLVDRWREPLPDPGTIVVDGRRAGGLTHPEAPLASLTPEELREALGSWIDEEVLVREARRYGLERSDVLVRRRLAKKMLRLLEDLHPVPEPTTAELEAWLAEHPERYATPAAVSFRHVFFSRGKRGERLEAEALAALRRLENGAVNGSSPGDPSALGDSVERADARVLERHFGRRFANAVAGAPLDDWTGPIESSLGLHLVRVLERHPPRAARLEDVRERVAVDWRVAQREEITRKALDSRIARYRFVVEAEGAP